MPRPRTVISPPLPAKPSRVKPSTKEQVEYVAAEGAPMWRVREPSNLDPKAIIYCDSRDEAEMMASPTSLIETLTPPTWGPPARDVPTVLDLAEQGMAREHDGKWIISPIGQEVLNDAMVGRDE